MRMAIEMGWQRYGMLMVGARSGARSVIRCRGLLSSTWSDYTCKDSLLAQEKSEKLDQELYSPCGASERAVAA